MTRTHLENFALNRQRRDRSLIFTYVTQFLKENPNMSVDHTSPNGLLKFLTLFLIKWQKAFHRGFHGKLFSFTRVDGWGGTNDYVLCKNGWVYE